MNFDNLQEVAIKAAIEAGKAVLEVYNSDDFEVNLKSDNSPLTLADRKAHLVIVEYLSKTGLPILSEEGREMSYEERKNWKYFWLVDPLDGTKEFIKRNGEFTVNIALIYDGTPILGVIYVPVLNELYFADTACGAFKKENVLPGSSEEIDIVQLIEQSDELPLKGLKDKFTIVGSRSHKTPETEEFMNHLAGIYGDVDIISKGSSLKLCMVAEGRADVYPRFAPTMEWDTAAGHAIALGAGFVVTQQDGKTPVVYNKENLLNPWFIVKKEDLKY
ncbi:MAG: 3'(2'),5'-bisphosphate nucleotidase CysQ [Bacteroidales bacterium]|nr:3'(2'),5'-bisphosphate nucleotidase CysQ [Bacteroidales bacterium]MCF8455597.1 3'(2'),5'-bisphosphate nucleotidase CysQ [Bacteroidales bacterium]